MIIRLLARHFLSLQFGSGEVKWRTLEHNGVMFPPPYEPQGIALVYEGKPVKLPPLAEEYAMLYARYLDTDYVKMPQFNRNFWRDWAPALKGTPVASLSGCDFSKFKAWLAKDKERKQAMSKEDKEQQRLRRIEEEALFRTATVDGKPQPVGNFRVEPPGVFLGRGDHPKLGSIKRRVMPEDVTINIGKGVPVPKTPPGHRWGKVIHDQGVEWLASWKDDITGKMKYVWLGNASEFKARSDMSKFELARELKKVVVKIRKENAARLATGDPKTRQLATALYFIDTLALRVGNEKGEDESDTVGVTSLRVEHVHLLDGFRIKLDFLGKDSVRYVNEVQVDQVVYDNVQSFCRDKSKDDMLFDLINSNQLNRYLQEFMPKLTAKVFRTFNASHLFQQELNEIATKYKGYDKPDRVNLLLDKFNQANAKVACLCNHQKNVSKGYKEQMQKIDARIKELTEKKKAYQAKGKDTSKVALAIEKLKRKKLVKKELKNLSLGTSKINYIDPRISVAFLKKHDLPVDKIFSKTLIEKFQWAFDVGDDWQF
jgi:DNA topoisomerase I